VDKRFVEIEYQQLVESRFFKLEVYPFVLRDLGEGFDLLDVVDAVEDAKGQLFVHRHLQ